MKTVLLAVFFSGALVAVTPAQMNPEKAVLNAQDQFFDIKKRSIEIERMKREANKRPARPDYAAAFPEIKKDFEKIQTINNDLQRRAAPADGKTESLGKSVSEIKHRAARLLRNLFPDAEDGAGKTDETPVALEGAANVGELLARLDKTIRRFVNNPIFGNLKLVDSADSLRAEQDLQTIVRLCEAVKARNKVQAGS